MRRVDVLTPAQRSHCMSRIRGRNTRPEMIVRRAVHAMGFRYVLHGRSLPGCPDLVFARLRSVIFVNGCFWHRHRCRFGRPTPKTNASFWAKKLERNVRRDRANRRLLRRAGWRILVAWECWERTPLLEQRLARFLSEASDGSAKAGRPDSPADRVQTTRRHVSRRARWPKTPPARMGPRRPPGRGA
jgi:DNA mismatch endonuclease (patch repair protein)